MISTMKKFLCCLLVFIGFSAVSLAQQSYFIYIQSETKDPFAVVIGGKTYHASNGYLIVPQLYNGNHQMFLQVHQQPRLSYQLTVKGKDIGLSLQKIKDAYKLLNLQTNEVIEPLANDASKQSVPASPQKTGNENAFKQYQTRTIIKTAQNATTDGVAIAFIDYQQLSKDTVNITIPTSGADTHNTVNNAVTAEPQKKESSVTTSNINSKNDCKSIAQEDDFYAARINMAKAKSNLKMMEAAEKAFKNRCYTTEQIKNLGSLFLSDLSRLSFFEMAFKHVADSQNFHTLEDQLIDGAFRASFKQMFPK